MLARLTGREDSRTLDFEEVKAQGFAPLLEVFYDTNAQLYPSKEVRLADIAIAEFDRFAAEGEVDEVDLKSFYALHSPQVFTTEDGSAIRPYEEVVDEVRTLVRKRDAS